MTQDGPISGPHSICSEIVSGEDVLLLMALGSIGDPAARGIRSGPL